MILGRLNRVGIAAPSIGDSVAFYRDVMGAEVIHAAFGLPAQIAGGVASHYNDM